MRLLPTEILTAVTFTPAQVKVKVHRPGQLAFDPRFLLLLQRNQNRRHCVTCASLRSLSLHSAAPGSISRHSAHAKPVRCAAVLRCADALGLIASFQRAVSSTTSNRRPFQAAEALGARTILVSGGVAANRELRVRFTGEAVTRGLPIAFPSLALSTDNAAMIAAAALAQIPRRRIRFPGSLSAQPSLAPGSVGSSSCRVYDGQKGSGKAYDPEDSERSANRC